MRPYSVLLALVFCAALAFGAPGGQEEGRSYFPDNQLYDAGSPTVPKNFRTALIDIAREMISRSASVSQVLSLNLTNLVILLVLKALLFGAGLFSFGYFKRSSDESFVTESEALLLLSYLLSDSSSDYQCMYRVACEDPGKAREYLTASKMAIKGAKMLKGIVPFDPKYEKIVYGLQEAVEYSMAGGQCPSRYTCKHIGSQKETGSS